MLLGMMQTGFFGGTADAAPDYTIAVQEFDLGVSTTGTLDVTASLGGLTPKAVFILGSMAIGTTETAGANLTFGSYDGTNQYCAIAYSRDAQSVSESNGITTATAVYRIMIQANGTAKRAVATQFITDGVRLDRTASNSSNIRASMIAFAGAGLEAATGNIDLGTGTSAIPVSLAFQPDIVILYGSNVTALDVHNTASAEYTFGYCTSDYTQRSVIFYETDNAADGDPNQTIRNDCAGGKITTTTLNYTYIVSNFNSGGFDVTPSANTGGRQLQYLALKLTGGSAKILDFDSRTTTGSQSITGAGFTPRFAIAVMTNLEAVNTIASNTALAAGCGVGLIGDEQWATSMRIDENAGGNSDTANQIINSAIIGASDTNCDAIIANLTSFDSDGMTLDYTAVQGTAKKGFILFIE